MVPPASNLALVEPALVPAPPLPRRAPARDVSFQLAALHERHAAELLRFCRWMLRDSEDAADALQDTWIRAMSALADGGVRVASMRPWLYAIARNACLDRLRERKRASNHELDESALGEGPAADEVADLRHEARAALALLGTLSERQRSALLMREVAGMSVPEIADALGISVDRATWTIADARKALEASDGAALACDVARDRVDRGARGRAVRAHLSSCGACRAHDRAMRAKRVLAPALLPLLWVRRGLVWLASPAAVAVVATTVALPHASAPPAVPHAAPAPAPALRVVPAPRHEVPSPRAMTPVHAAPRRATTSTPLQTGPATGSPRAASQPMRVPEAVPAPNPQPVSVPIVASTRHLVHDAVDTTQRAVDTIAPAATPVVDRATAAVRQLAPGL